MKKVKFLAMLMMAFLACASFTACGDDDDDQSNGNGGNGSGGSTSFSLVGRSFAYYYAGVNGDGMPEEWTTTVTFVNETQCNVNDKGYQYIYYDRYKKEYWDETKSCTYSVSGTTITLHNYPFYAFGGDKTYTYLGSYLKDAGDDIYTEIK